MKDYIFYSTSKFNDNIAQVKFHYKDEPRFIDNNGEILNYKMYPKIKNGYEDTYVIYDEQNNILQIRSSQMCIVSIDKFEEEIIAENLGKSDKKSFLRLARKIRKDFGLEKQDEKFKNK